MKSYIGTFLKAASLVVFCKPVSGKCPAEFHRLKKRRHFKHFKNLALYTSYSVRYI